MLTVFFMISTKLLMRHKIHKTIIILTVIIFSSTVSLARTNYSESVKALISHGAVLVTNSDNVPILAINENEALVPASIFKVITASAAFHYLKENYRFKTEFYFDKKNNLYIKGYGDPMMISEELNMISDIFKGKGVEEIASIFLDNSFFDKDIYIDGVESSQNPYDATNGALCVNFNTLNVTINKDGSVVSREIQTPMTNFAKKIVKDKISSQKITKQFDDRIILSHQKDETLLYVGHLFREFLKLKKIEVKGRIKKGDVAKEAELFYTHSSSKKLKEVVTAMMKYSNNYIANQIFLAMGAKVYGAPATVRKGIDATKKYLEEELKISGVLIAEGSGISRKNRISAVNYMKALTAYKKKWRKTLTNEGNLYYKTGTLKDVKTVSGYMDKRTRGIYNFVIMLNDERDFQKRDKILRLIDNMVSGED